MRELQVREAVRAGPLRRYLRDANSRVIDELAICLGEARIDIAVVNGKLSGYELKSESDTLTRLPKQAEAYARVFDEVSLVIDQRHCEAAATMVPETWGIYQVGRNSKGTAVVCNLRKAQQTVQQDPYAIAQLLWHSEALEIISRVSGKSALSSKPRSWLWRELASSMTLSSLKAEVRQALKHRSAWRT